MKVLFLASRDSGHPQAAGGDIQLHALAEYLATRGHAPIYACMRRSGAERDEHINGVRVLRGRGPLTQAAWASWNYMRRWSRRAGRVDVVVEEAIGGLLIPYAAPLFVRRPLVTFWYQVNAPLFRAEFSRPVASALVHLERRLARLHHRAVIATPTAFQAERLQSLGFRRAQIHVVPNGLDWPAGTPEPLAARDPLVVYLGKLRRYKCPHHLLDVAVHLKRTAPEARIVIAGRPDGTGFDRWLEDQVHRRGLRDRVTVKRSVPEETKRDLLRRARVLVLCSPTEGFGISILEANRLGTPVVVSEGVPPEVVEHEANGLRVPFADTASLTAAVSRLLRDDRTWERMSRTAWETARQFTWSQAGARLEEAIEDAVRGQGAAHARP